MSTSDCSSDVCSSDHHPRPVLRTGSRTKHTKKKNAIMVINSAAWIPHPAGIGGPGSRLIESFTSGPSLIARSSSDWGAMHAAPEHMNDVLLPLRRHLAVRADQDRKSTRLNSSH